MVSNLNSLRYYARRRRRQRGQGISEYAFLVAFIMTLAAIGLVFANGTFSRVLADSFGNAASALVSLASNADSAEPPM